MSGGTLGDAPTRPVQTARPDRIPAEGRRVAVVVGWIAIVAPFAAEALAIVRANRSWLLHRLPDDGFYYLQVARRLADGQGFTFDGVHETNGFHPLWQALLVPSSRVFDSDTSLAKAALVLGVLLSLAAVVLVVRVVARVAGIGAALFGGLVAVHGTNVVGAWANGMEGPVVLLTLALVLVGLAWWAEEPDGRPAMVVGALSATVVLARLDLVAVVWIVPLAMAWRVRSIGAALRWLLGAAVIAVPFAVAWFVRWGHLLTTSATVKDVWMSDLVANRYGSRWSRGYAGFLWDTSWDYVASLLRRVHPGSRPVAVLTRVGLLVLAGAGAAVAIRRHPRQAAFGPAGWAIAVVAGVVAVKAAVDVVAAPLWATAWYAAPQQLLVPFAVGVFAWIAVCAVARRSEVVGIGLAVLVVVSVLPASLSEFTVSGRREPISGRWQDELAVAADWIADAGPPGRYGAFDAGLLGYELYGERTLVNLDGLVNDYGFAELVAARAPAIDRIRYTEVDYVVNRLTEERLTRELACATPVWQSEVPVPYSDASNREGTEGYVYVLDVRGCRG